MKKEKENKVIVTFDNGDKYILFHDRELNETELVDFVYRLFNLGKHMGYTSK